MRRTITKLTEWLFELKFFSFHYWRAPRGPKGVKKSLFFYKWNCFLFALRLPPKDTNFKNHQNWRKMSKEPCFLGLFQKFFNLGAILAHQTSTGMFSGSWRIFWHPWDPCWRVNSRDIWVLRFVLIILCRWRHLADFSLLWKCCPMSALYSRSLKIVVLSVLMATIS